MGRVIEDTEGVCGDNELLVRFDDPLPFLKQSAIAGYGGKHYSEDTMYETKEVVRVEDLVIDGDIEAEIESERQAEGAWLRHAEYHPEVDEDDSMLGGYYNNPMYK